MIQKNEIRVGNIVKRSYSDDVLTIDIDLFKSICRQPVTYSPIPLTEEWLTRFGIKGRPDFKYKGIFGVQTRGGKFYVALKDLSNVIFHSVVEVKHVHTLQNLYFALTNEELTLIA